MLADPFCDAADRIFRQTASQSRRIEGLDGGEKTLGLRAPCRFVGREAAYRSHEVGAVP